jgi:hypothetical protein
LGLFYPKYISNSPSPLQTSRPAQPTVVEDIPASVSLETKSSSYAIGETVSVSVTIDSGSNDVGAADFIITYDPTLLKAGSITPGSFFKSIPVKKISNGSIKLSALAEITDSRVLFPKGKGVVAIIDFKVLKANPSTLISFDSEKTIIASDGRNIVNKLNNLKLVTHE